MVKKILMLNGPNLNLLGLREPHIYGATTLQDVERAAHLQATQAGVELVHFQSNHEGDLIDRIHAAREDGVDFVIINPGGLTHTSVALRDALSGIDFSFIEIHISNIHKREVFRRHSFLSEIAVGVIAGFGVDGYRLAIDFAVKNY